MDDYINPRDVLKAEEEERKQAARSRPPRSFPERPEKDVLLFLIEHAPLKPWQRDVLSIIRDEAYYFTPQGQTKMASRDLAHGSFAIYSGQRLDSDPSRGLSGECDFILTLTAPLPVLQAPIVIIVEAKKNDIEAGLGQCAAQMVGARLFNQQEGNGLDMIFGCVTTGEGWQFLQLEHDVIVIDSVRYYIDRVETILGVFQAILACYTPSLTPA